MDVDFDELVRPFFGLVRLFTPDTDTPSFLPPLFSRKAIIMRRTMHVFLAVLTLGLLSNTLSAQEPIQFARTPDISPDGKLVAFSYLGDIWVVEAIGGKARPVTT